MTIWKVREYAHGAYFVEPDTKDTSVRAFAGPSAKERAFREAHYLNTVQHNRHRDEITKGKPLLIDRLQASLTTRFPELKASKKLRIYLNAVVRVVEHEYLEQCPHQ